MQYIEYLNHPIHTVSAKDQLRALISAALPRLKWSAAELSSAPRPQRKHPQSAEQPERFHNAGLLPMSELLAVVPAGDVARIAGISERELATWRTRVPLGYSAYLRELVQHYPAMRKAQELMQEGAKLPKAAREVRYDPSDLRELMQHFSMLPADQ